MTMTMTIDAERNCKDVRRTVPLRARQATTKLQCRESPARIKHSNAPAKAVAMEMMAATLMRMTANLYFQAHSFGLHLPICPMNILHNDLIRSILVLAPSFIIV